MDELRFANGLRIVVTRVIETVNACFDGAVSSQRMDFQCSGNKFL